MTVWVESMRRFRGMPPMRRYRSSRTSSVMWKDSRITSDRRGTAREVQSETKQLEKLLKFGGNHGGVTFQTHDMRPSPASKSYWIIIDHMRYFRHIEVQAPRRNPSELRSWVPQRFSKEFTVTSFWDLTQYKHFIVENIELDSIRDHSCRLLTWVRANQTALSLRRSWGIPLIAFFLVPCKYIPTVEHAN